MITRSMRAPAWLAALAMSVAGRPAAAQWAPLDQLPGAARVQAIRAPSGAAGTVSDVRWDPAGGKVWFQYAGEWRSVPLAGGAPEQGGEPPEAVPEPKRYRAPRGGRAQQATRVPSPDGRWVAEHADGNVRLVPASGGEPVAVTTEGGAERWFGSADWVYGEELDQTSAMWWSPDSTRLAYYDFNEAGVPRYTLLAGLAGLRTRAVPQWYPKPGDANPVAKLEIHHLDDRTRTTVDVGEGDQYVYGAQWSPNGDALLFFRAPRRQDAVELVASDPRTGATRTVVAERQASWQRNSPTIRFLADGERFLWESESNGYANWHLRHLDGRLLAKVTDDPWVAEGIVMVDEEAGWVYYMARSSPTAICSQLHRARLDGSARERLTSGDLHHSNVSIAPDHSHFVATRQFVDRAPQTVLFRIDGTEVATLTKPIADPFAKQGLQPPEFLRFPSADGAFELYGILSKPPDFDPSKRYPLVVETYGGPLFATVFPRWAGVDARVGHGVLVARVDNRGTPGRGKAFEAATYLALGGPDVDDQAQLVRELAKRPYVDATRVAVTGHSYGGYMALMCLLRHPEVFSVAVAGAPPTDWRQYDTIYTERVMRTPAENEAGYDAGSAITLADRLRGRVLLLHGMMDDNVHPSNTFALAAAWQSRSIPFEMMLFPNDDHGIRSPAYEAAKWGFILRHLGVWQTEGPAPTEPPQPMNAP
ncbi:MAG: Prolyl tripeptidyl peptidase precursor [Planctomycetota bacterium]